MFIELHMIQNFAPSNLNRDDTNNPKDCVFGGVRRARISSQCLKYAIRHAPVFAQVVGDQIGIRTRRIVTELKTRLTTRGVEESLATTVARACVEAYLTTTAKKKEDKEVFDKDGIMTKVLLYLSTTEIDELATEIMENWDTFIEAISHEKPDLIPLKNIAKNATKQAMAPDIALFGRMLADRPETNVAAACQVAHAISTHRVSMDIDFFTAVDDLLPGEETGAGMVGVTGFNSATFYRYARLDWDQLVANLYGQTDTARRAVEGFLRAAVEAVPTGKQNSFAAHNRPDFLLGVIRPRGMGWSLANAFERPVNPRSDNGLMAPSVTALDNYWGRLSDAYGFEGEAAALVLGDTIQLNTLGKYKVDKFDLWIDTLMAALPRE